MKKMLFLFLLLPLFADAQIFYPYGYPLNSTTFTFSSNDSLIHYLAGSFDSGIYAHYYDTDTPTITIDTSADTPSGRLWQIGNTFKPIFSTDSIAVRGIMTDTLNSYPTNANDYFILKIDSMVPNFIVDIWHKYETDSLHAGGIVEYSFDTITWINVANCSYLYTQNVYSQTDTIISGQPAFTGNSRGEQLSRIQFLNCLILEERQTSTYCTYITPQNTIYLRFRFVSDSTIDSLSGWMIDSIRIENPGCMFSGSGYVSKVSNNNSLNISPNPVTAELTITATNKINSVTIFNLLGQTLLTQNYNSPQVQIDVSSLPSGLYFIKINGSEVRRFVKE